MATKQPMKVQVAHDTSKETPDEGVSYMHCAQCLNEWKSSEHLRTTVAPKHYARMQVALTADGGLQVWCTRHECNIDKITFTVKKEERDGTTRHRRRR